MSFYASNYSFFFFFLEINIWIRQDFFLIKSDKFLTSQNNSAEEMIFDEMNIWKVQINFFYFSYSFYPLFYILTPCIFVYSCSLSFLPFQKIFTFFTGFFFFRGISVISKLFLIRFYQMFKKQIDRYFFYRRRFLESSIVVNS